MADMPFEGYYRHLLDAIMRQQMGQAQGISNAVPRGNSPLPELPTSYRPPERYNYGAHVRLAGNEFSLPDQSNMPELKPPNLDKLAIDPDEVMRYRDYILRKLGPTENT